MLSAAGTMLSERRNEEGMRVMKDITKKMIKDRARPQVLKPCHYKAAQSS